MSTILSPTSCKILLISPNSNHAQQLAHRIIRFARNEATDMADPSARSAIEASSGSTIPWKISNKYYTAEVHFECITIDQCLHRRNDLDGVPAVLFAWNYGQSYKEDFERVVGAINSLEPEIKLAIQFSMDKFDSVVTATTPSDDDQEVDDFVSSYGFEFIDGDNDSRARVLDSDGDYTATPGLGRVVDALSTIMWPSMVQSSSSGPSSKRKSRAMELLDWARQEEYEDGLCALVQSPIDEAEGDTDNPSSSIPTPPPSQAKAKMSRMQKEIDDFERWLEEDESQRVNEDPWACRDEFGSPLATESGAKTPTFTTFFGSGTGFGDGGHGFEDDFTDFVGAPMDHELRRPESNSTRGRYFAYTSLDSEFDMLEDGDTGIPPQDEIEATTRRIFGSTSSHLSTSSSESKSQQRQHLLATNISGLGASPAPSTSTLGDEDDFGRSPFDLSRVFGALQVMKEEISEMTDDGERRRAAARVALGLVYGLQRDEDTDVQ
ncbi:hypothetical protein BJ322DRAFT_1076996 [Thelephora terrestris]|uniref:Alpha/gamma-adaptin-binding protein p34 n=1 Tax=Thelephora terrestris TaxID=56493 RepID=A0A9P6HAA4_9AGAM|nr:hypothetical protein BJ322DRAFT_1076996 [Thelephora terrestris]